MVLNIFSKNNFILKKRSNIFSCVQDGWNVIKNGDGYLYKFNEEGNFIWGLIENKYSIEDIYLSYSKKYSINLEDSKSDVEEFIFECKKDKLIY